jgi:hypothetical protein
MSILRIVGVIKTAKFTRPILTPLGENRLTGHLFTAKSGIRCDRDAVSALLPEPETLFPERILGGKKAQGLKHVRENLPIAK